VTAHALINFAGHLYNIAYQTHTHTMTMTAAYTKLLSTNNWL